MSASSRKETHINTESKGNLYMDLKKSVAKNVLQTDRQNMEILSMLRV